MASVRSAQVTLRYTAGNSDKLYVAHFFSQDGQVMHMATRYGSTRTGATTAGIEINPYDTKEAIKLIGSKLKKGYQLESILVNGNSRSLINASADEIVKLVELTICMEHFPAQPEAPGSPKPPPPPGVALPKAPPTPTFAAGAILPIW